MILQQNHFCIGGNYHFSYDNVNYVIDNISFNAVGNYAECVIRDGATGNRYHINGRIELNGHVFEIKREEEYNSLQDRYVPAHNYTIYINE